MAHEQSETDADLNDHAVSDHDNNPVTAKEPTYRSKWCSAMLLRGQHEHGKHERTGDEHLDEDALRAVNSWAEECAMDAHERSPEVSN